MSHNYELEPISAHEISIMIDALKMWLDDLDFFDFVEAPSPQIKSGAVSALSKLSANSFDADDVLPLSGNELQAVAYVVAYARQSLADDTLDTSGFPSLVSASALAQLANKLPTPPALA